MVRAIERGLRLNSLEKAFFRLYLYLRPAGADPCRKGQGGSNLFGLYDPDGVLRFMGSDKEACLAYAELFDLPSTACCLMTLPESEGDSARARQKSLLGVRSN